VGSTRPVARPPSTEAPSLDLVQPPFQDSHYQVGVRDGFRISFLIIFLLTGVVVLVASSSPLASRWQDLRSFACIVSLYRTSICAAMGGSSGISVSKSGPPHVFRINFQRSSIQECHLLNVATAGHVLDRLKRLANGIKFGGVVKASNILHWSFGPAAHSESGSSSACWRQ
jgi:hypothetical protein